MNKLPVTLARFLNYSASPGRVFGILLLVSALTWIGTNELALLIRSQGTVFFTHLAQFFCLQIALYLLLPERIFWTELLVTASSWLGFSIVVRLGDMYFEGVLLENLGAMFSNSISLSSILILTALGLAITFGVMRVINMAHGDLMMLGAYTAFFFTNKRALPIVVRNIGNWFDMKWDIEFGFELSLYLAIPLSFLVVALVGYLMEVLLIRHLYARPLDTLLATWGVGMILQQSVYHLFGPNLQPMSMPAELQGGLHVGELTIPWFRFFIVGVTLLCLLLVYLWFYWTSFGLKVRAVVQNRAMASALGVSTRRVDAVSFAFASGLAGVAGCIFAHLYNVNYGMGSEYVVDAFMVVILGGLGQIPGAIAGGALIGTSNNVITKVYAFDEVIAKVMVLLMIVAFIMVRPSGLVKTRERSYD